MDLRTFSLDDQSNEIAEAANEAQISDGDFDADGTSNLLKRQVMWDISKAVQLKEDQKNEESLGFFERALKNPGIPQEVACFIHTSISSVLIDTSDFSNALVHAQKAMDIINETPFMHRDDSLKSVGYTTLGMCYYRQCNYPESKNAFDMAYKTAHDSGDVELQLTAAQNLGNVHASMGNFKEAIKFHREQRRSAAAFPDGPFQTRAKAEAALNLESDYNSIKEYALADDNARLKLHHSGSKYKISEPLGDVKANNVVYSAWLVQAREGGVLTSSTRSSKGGSQNRKWCVLTSKGFYAFSSSSSLIEPDISIPIGSISKVEVFNLTQIDLELDISRSFKIKTTREASYIFSCQHSEDCVDWINAFSCTRTQTNRFAKFTTLQRATSKAAENVFDTTSVASNDMDYIMTTFSQPPEAFAVKKVENPLYTSGIEGPGGDQDFEEDGVLFSHVDMDALPDAAEENSNDVHGVVSASFPDYGQALPTRPAASTKASVMIGGQPSITLDLESHDTNTDEMPTLSLGEHVSDATNTDVILEMNGVEEETADHQDDDVDGMADTAIQILQAMEMNDDEA